MKDMKQTPNKRGPGTLAGAGNLSSERGHKVGPGGYRDPCGYGKKGNRKKSY